jgi:Lon-like ATP-dependent protease
VPEAVLAALDVHYVANVWSALDVAFGEGPWSERAREMKGQEDAEEASDKQKRDEARSRRQEEAARNQDG